jgi:high-affinity Fe2+/Pb2+ permease
LGSELPYTGISLAALWALGRAEVSNARPAWLLLSTMLGLAAYYTRTSGIALAVALAVSMVIWPLFARNNRSKWIRLSSGLVMFAGVIAWLIYCYKAKGGGRNIYL